MPNFCCWTQKERSSIAGAPQMRRAINRLAKKAETIFHGDKPLSEDPTNSVSCTQFHLDLDALEMTELRGLAAQREGEVQVQNHHY